MKYILEYLNIKYINLSHLRQTVQSVEEDFKLLAYYTHSQLFLGFWFLNFFLVMSLTFLLRIKFQCVISNFIFVCALFLPRPFPLGKGRGQHAVIKRGEGKGTPKNLSCDWSTQKTQVVQSLVQDGATSVICVWHCTMQQRRQQG